MLFSLGKCKGNGNQAKWEGRRNFPQPSLQMVMESEEKHLSFLLHWGRDSFVSATGSVLLSTPHSLFPPARPPFPRPSRLWQSCLRGSPWLLGPPSSPLSQEGLNEEFSEQECRRIGKAFCPALFVSPSFYPQVWAPSFKEQPLATAWAEDTHTLVAQADLWKVHIGWGSQLRAIWAENAEDFGTWSFQGNKKRLFAWWRGECSQRKARADVLCSFVRLVTGQYAYAWKHTHTQMHALLPKSYTKRNMLSIRGASVFCSTSLKKILVIIH